jgi:Uma2 family endonuclease
VGDRIPIERLSAEKNRHTKGRLYAAHGMPEFWLVDVGGKRLVRHRAPQQGEYTLVDEPDPGTALDVSALPGVTIDLRRLFG